MYFVYILKSLIDNGYYIGCTSDLNNRIKDHNAGRTKSLKARRPLELVYVEEFSDAAAAYQREKTIKQYKGGEAFKKLLINQMSS
ncbi:MAG: GIY-YIG nuclease family protein [Patescibacteria group bacterium]